MHWDAQSFLSFLSDRSKAISMFVPKGGRCSEPVLKGLSES